MKTLPSANLDPANSTPVPLFMGTNALLSKEGILVIATSNIMFLLSLRMSDRSLDLVSSSSRWVARMVNSDKPCGGA